MESKFLDQDIDVVFLANKCIVVGGFVGRNYNKILMETGTFMDNIRVTKNGLVLFENLTVVSEVSQKNGKNWHFIPPF